MFNQIEYNMQKCGGRCTTRSFQHPNTKRDLVEITRKVYTPALLCQISACLGINESDMDDDLPELETPMENTS